MCILTEYSMYRTKNCRNINFPIECKDFAICYVWVFQCSLFTLHTLASQHVYMPFTVCKMMIVWFMRLPNNHKSRCHELNHPMFATWLTLSHPSSLSISAMIIAARQAKECEHCEFRSLSLFQTLCYNTGWKKQKKTITHHLHIQHINYVPV